MRASPGQPDHLYCGQWRQEVAGDSRRWQGPYPDSVGLLFRVSSQECMREDVCAAHVCITILQVLISFVCQLPGERQTPFDYAHTKCLYL